MSSRNVTNVRLPTTQPPQTAVLPVQPRPLPPQARRMRARAVCHWMAGILAGHRYRSTCQNLFWQRPLPDVAARKDVQLNRTAELAREREHERAQQQLASYGAGKAEACTRLAACHKYRWHASQRPRHWAPVAISGRLLPLHAATPCLLSRAGSIGARSRPPS